MRLTLGGIVLLAAGLGATEVPAIQAAQAAHTAQTTQAAEAVRMAETPGPAAAPPAAPEPLRVEHTELVELLEESGVAQRSPSPGLVAWVEELISRVSLRLGRRIRQLFDRLEGWLLTSLESLGLPSGVWLRRTALAIVVVALVLVLVQGLRALAARRRRGKLRSSAAGETVALPAPRAAGADDAAAWRGEAERRLAEGRLAEALEAVWWWLARALAGERADPSWTGRELLLHAGRRDLAPVVRRLEAMTYGPVRPAAAEVHGFVAELAGALP